MQVTPRTYAKRIKDEGLATWQKITKNSGAGNVSESAAEKSKETNF